METLEISIVLMQLGNPITGRLKKFIMIQLNILNINAKFNRIKYDWAL